MIENFSSSRNRSHVGLGRFWRLQSYEVRIKIDCIWNWDCIHIRSTLWSSLQSHLVPIVIKIAIIFGSHHNNYCNHKWFDPIFIDYFRQLNGVLSKMSTSLIWILLILYHNLNSVELWYCPVYFQWDISGMIARQIPWPIIEPIYSAIITATKYEIESNKNAYSNWS